MGGRHLEEDRARRKKRTAILTIRRNLDDIKKVRSRVHSRVCSTVKVGVQVKFWNKLWNELWNILFYVV